jgi:hypothetical protein
VGKDEETSQGIHLGNTANVLGSSIHHFTSVGPLMSDLTRRPLVGHHDFCCWSAIKQQVTWYARNLAPHDIITYV